MRITAFFILLISLTQPVYGNSDLADPCQICKPEFPKEPNPSIVMVIVYEESTRRHFQGSGFFVNQEGDVLTSYHVVENKKDISIRTSDAKIYKVTNIISKNVFGDLAKLAVDIPKEMVTPVQLSDVPPMIAEEITVIGHPLGHRQNITHGKVSSLFPVNGLGNLIQFSAAITTGSSGSPIFNLAGQVVGVASFMLFTGQNTPTLNYAVPVNQLLNM